MNERGMGRKLEQGRQLELVRASMLAEAHVQVHAEDLEIVLNGALDVVALGTEDLTEPKSREPFMQLWEEARAAV